MSLSITLGVGENINIIRETERNMLPYYDNKKYRTIEGFEDYEMASDCTIRKKGRTWPLQTHFVGNFACKGRTGSAKNETIRSVRLFKNGVPHKLIVSVLHKQVWGKRSK